MSVAVVIPLYNHAAYIGPALESVLAQTRPVDRIVIIDDGSQDDSVAVAQSFKDSRIRITTQPNAGAHTTINRAIEMASDCDFIAILNSDDVFEPGRIELCEALLESVPAVDVVCTRLRIIDSKGTVLGKDSGKVRWMNGVWTDRQESLPEWLGIANFVKTTSNLVARSAYLRAHPFRPYRYIHDYFFVLIAALEHKLAVVEEEQLRYRVHDSNTIKSGPADNLTREMVRMNADLLREIAPALATNERMRADYARYLRRLFQNYADFRAEVFVHFLAQAAGGMTEERLDTVVSGLTVEKFPELTAQKSDAMNRDLEQLKKRSWPGFLR